MCVYVCVCVCDSCITYACYVLQPQPKPGIGLQHTSASNIIGECYTTVCVLCVRARVCCVCAHVCVCVGVSEI